MNIRHATVDDAKRLAALILQVESESDYLLFEAGERKLTPEQQRSHLEAITNEDNATILLAEMDEGELVVYLLARGDLQDETDIPFTLSSGCLPLFGEKESARCC